MIEERIIKYKNIIFFKIVLHLLFIILFIWIIPYNLSSHKSAESKLVNIQELASDTMYKINLLSTQKDIIRSTYNTYKILHMEPSNISCLVRLRIANRLKKLDQEFLISDPLSFDFPASKIAVLGHQRENATIRTTSLHTKFSSSSFEKFFDILKEVSKQMPENTTINKIEINKSLVLNPIHLMYINQGYEPGLVSGEVNFEIRELRLKDD